MTMMLTFGRILERGKMEDQEEMGGGGHLDRRGRLEGARLDLKKGGNTYDVIVHGITGHNVFTRT